MGFSITNHEIVAKPIVRAYRKMNFNDRLLAINGNLFSNLMVGCVGEE